ncbi:MAG: TRAP transporter small permease [Pseudomonadota bacterium]|nr:MAG: TRAP transporter small permease [Pseudomonadota bacterium]
MTRTHQTGGALGRTIRGLEHALLTVLFLTLVLLGLTQIGLRNFAGIALPWADGAMRALVLWLTMVGSVVASGQLRHIRIDLAERWLAPAARLWLRRGMFLGTASICLAMTWLGLRIVALEYEFRALAFLSVPTWTVQAIVPLGFGVMAARFAAWTIRPPSRLLSADRPALRDDA